MSVDRIDLMRFYKFEFGMVCEFDNKPSKLLHLVMIIMHAQNIHQQNLDLTKGALHELQICVSFGQSD